MATRWDAGAAGAEGNTMAHPNEVMIRELYAAFARGEMGEVLARCTEDVTFVVPGASRVAGEYRGHDGFLTRFLPALAAVADMSSFSEDVDGVACDDDHGVVLTTQRFRRHDGEPVEYRSAVLLRFRNGRMSEFREHPGDPEAYDRAWR